MSTNLRGTQELVSEPAGSPSPPSPDSLFGSLSPDPDVSPASCTTIATTTAKTTTTGRTPLATWSNSAPSTPSPSLQFKIPSNDPALTQCDHGNPPPSEQSGRPAAVHLRSRADDPRANSAFVVHESMKYLPKLRGDFSRGSLIARRPWRSRHRPAGWRIRKRRQRAARWAAPTRRSSRGLWGVGARRYHSAAFAPSC